MFTLSDLTEATAFVHQRMLPTAQLNWPTLSARCGAEVWVKHENHTPTGAFKLRGALTYIDWLRRTAPQTTGIITATRGNHGQGQARAATAAGLQALVYVPRGNSVEKNAAMQGFGATLVEFGDDFDTARLEALRVAEAQNLAVVPSFHRELVRGVATYAVELFTAQPDLDTVYVPIGCGSGICGTIAARDAMGLRTKIVGVVSDQADGALLSVQAGRLIQTQTPPRTIADGMAVRIPVQEAFDIYAKGADRILSVTDDEVAAAIRAYFADTHNLAEGAGAAPLAALLQERAQMQGKKVGVILCGGNIDTAWMAEILAGRTPKI